MNLQLLITAGPETGRAIILQPGLDLMMGRAHNSYYRINDAKCSRYHCEFLLEDNHVTVICNGGDGGTLVNGEPVQRHEVKLGDIVTIGETQLKLVDGDVKPERPKEKPKESPAAPEPPPTLTGTKLAHFEVGKQIGSGELSLIYLAKDTKSNRTVALRVLQPEFALDDERMKRFVNGMKTAMALRHPHVVTTYGAGKVGKNCWMAMEKVAGENMTKVIGRVAKGELADWKYVFGMLVHVARALDFAHKQGIVHRNLHPKNIYWDDTTETFKLGDLLSAKTQDAGALEMLTHNSQLAGGVVSFMSPEHTRGKGIDARSDLYCLGAIAYALLTGRPPVGGKTLSEQVARVRDASPERPTKYTPAIPARFEAIVLKLLSKDPENRFHSAVDLLAELERTGKTIGVHA